MNDETSTTAPRGRTLPRFDSRAHHRPADFATPLPPRLLDAMIAADVPEGKRHVELAQHHEKAAERKDAISAKLTATRDADEERAREALGAGKEKPAPRAPKIELELADARSDAQTLGELARDSARDLLAASIPFLADTIAAAESEKEAAIEEVRSALERAASAIEEVETRAGEVGWLRALEREPLRPGGAGCDPR
ncbi:MAG: hypothetical protein ACREQJ_11770, partial [Candidatus Binatia bacterium]